MPRVTRDFACMLPGEIMVWNALAAPLPAAPVGSGSDRCILRVCVCVCVLYIYTVYTIYTIYTIVYVLYIPYIYIYIYIYILYIYIYIYIGFCNGATGQ